jgi:hypothetical protein
MPQSTNLNVTPYYDDFDKTKNFYKVLFRPGFPIQARELTTMQSIMQNQIEAMGEHFFKEGSMVIPGQCGFDNNVDGILVQASFLGTNVEEYREQLVGGIITGLTTGVKAKVIYCISQNDSEKNFITIYVKYTESGGDDRNITKFLDNEQLIIDKDLTYGQNILELGSPFAQLLPTGSTTIGSTGYVNSGVYFIRGIFVNVPSQYVILEQYAQNPSYRVGLEISESIITSEDDADLNDNAAGSSNYAAPGAHRFRIKTVLIKKDIGDTSDKNFIELMRIVDGKIQSFVGRTAYNEIEKELARRSYDALGDFMITPFDMRLRECYNDGSGGGIGGAPGIAGSQVRGGFGDGVFALGEVTHGAAGIPGSGINIQTPTDIALAESFYTLHISPGRVYLRGYPVETVLPTFIDIPKSRQYTCFQNNIIPFELGNSIKVTKFWGAPVISGPDITTSYQLIELKDTYTTTQGVGAGNTIGTARLMAFENDSSGGDGVDSTDDDLYNMHLFDITMFTTLRLNASVTIEAGSLIIGKISGARGTIRVNPGTSSFVGQNLSLVDVQGIFRSGEVIQIDGRDKGTVNIAPYKYELSDIRQLVGKNAAGSSTIFTADTFNDQQQVLTGNYFTYSISGADKYLTGFSSNIAAEVRCGDLLYVSPTQFFVVDAVPTSLNLTTAIFSYSSQRIKVSTSSGFTPTTATQYQVIVRFRPQLSGLKDGDLFAEMPKTSIKSITDESAIVKRTYESQVTTNSFSISLAANEQFTAIDTDNYHLAITAVSGGSTYAVGDIITIQDDVSGGAAYGVFNSSGTPRTTLTVNNLVGITSVRLYASVSKNVLLKKIKNANKMSVFKVNRTFKQSDQIPFGLAYSNLYGTRIEDQELSLGVKDVYKLHAVYESTDDSEAILPSVLLVESAFFAIGSTVTGKTSSSKAIVVDFNPTTLKLSLVYVTSNQLIQNEIVTGFNSLNVGIQALVSDADGSIQNGSKNVTSSFTLNDGQTPFTYGISYLRRNNGSTAPIRKLKVVADFFGHELTGDYFNIDSYVGIDYAEIPSYTNKAGSGTTLTTVKPLRDVLDFRPGAKNLASGGGTVSNPYYLQCTSLDFASRVFDNQATVMDIPQVNSDFRCDYCYFLKRIDTVSVDQLGNFFVTIGTPSEEPTPPPEIENSMLLATLCHEAYGFNAYLDTRIFSENIRRYTMKDIADIDKRVKNIEYYSALTLLEQETNMLSIKDEFGNDKFKNGYVVDSFENQNVADLSNPDYNASLDFSGKILRPSHYTTNTSLTINIIESGNIAINNRIVTLPFTEVTLIQQPYASMVENVNPFNVFSFIGAIELNPASDDWIETRVAPAQVTQLEGNYQLQAERIGANIQTGVAPQVWNSWQEDWSGARRTVSGGEWRGWLGGLGRNIPGFGTRTTTTTGIIERRTGTQQRLVTRLEQRSLGSRVISKSNIPFIRSRNISFKAERLKPSANFFAFFDNVAVTQFCTPKLIELIKDPLEDAGTNNNPFIIGEDVVGYRILGRNATGGVTLRQGMYNLRTKVLAPNNGLKYNPYTDIELPATYTSTSTFLNIDTEAMASQANGDYSGNAEIGMYLIGVTSGARAIIRNKRFITDRKGTLKGVFFIPSGVDSGNPRWATGTRTFALSNSPVNQVGTTGSTAISNGTTQYSATGITETTQETILSIRNADIVTDQLFDQKTSSRTTHETVQIGYWDPLAQSFIVQERGGAFLTSAEVYFNSKDTNIPISAQLRLMSNGHPTPRTLPLSTVTVYPEDVEISENASIPTKFVFPAPVYVNDTDEYCLVIFSDSNEYTIWISEMGQVDVTGDRTISAQPYAGVLFKSQNASTWSANQLQDMKFTIYRGEFSTTPGKLALTNALLGVGNSGVARLQENPIQTKKANISLTLMDDAASFTLGARIYQKTTNASATVLEMDSVSSPNKIVVGDISGQFVEGSLIGSTISYGIVSSQSLCTLYVSTTAGVLTGNYTVGSTITGVNSSVTAIITGWNLATGQLILNYVSGTFTAGEVLRQSNPVVDSIILTSPSAPSYSGDTRGAYLISVPTYSSTERRITIKHPNHAMHDPANNVTITNAISEISPTTLRAALTIDGITVSVSDATAFHKVINGLPIGSDNPGYIIINGEIMAYTAINAEGTTITLKATGGRAVAGGAIAQAHVEGDIVEVYNLDGIPLIEINKTHSEIINPTLDSYQLPVSSISTVGINGGGDGVMATQNVQFEEIQPLIGNITVNETSISARLNVVSATSISSNSTNQPSFVNTGEYIPVDINENNHLQSPAMIISGVNESAKLSGNKSMNLELLLQSNNSKLTPVIDLDRCSVITITNRINTPADPNEALLATNDPHDATYITRMISLDNQISSTLKVYFDAWRPAETNFKVLYRVVPPGFSGDEETLSWAFFNTDGGPDKSVNPENEVIFRPYEYTDTGLEFIKFQIKIDMISTTQAKVPQIKYFRAIATV